MNYRAQASDATCPGALEATHSCLGYWLDAFTDCEVSGALATRLAGEPYIHAEHPQSSDLNGQYIEVVQGAVEREVRFRIDNCVPTFFGPLPVTGHTARHARARVVFEARVEGAGCKVTVAVLAHSSGSDLVVVPQTEVGRQKVRGLLHRKESILLTEFRLAEDFECANSSAALSPISVAEGSVGVALGRSQFTLDPGCAFGGLEGRLSVITPHGSCRLDSLVPGEEILTFDQGFLAVKEVCVLDYASAPRRPIVRLRGRSGAALSAFQFLWLSDRHARNVANESFAFELVENGAADEIEVCRRRYFYSVRMEQDCQIWAPFGWFAPANVNYRYFNQLQNRKFHTATHPNYKLKRRTT